MHKLDALAGSAWSVLGCVGESVTPLGPQARASPAYVLLPAPTLVQDPLPSCLQSLLQCAFPQLLPTALRSFPVSVISSFLHPSLLLEGLEATGSCSISEWTKSNYVFGSSLLEKITCCWWAKATGFVPVPGVVALVGTLRAKWGQWAAPWHKGVDLSRAQAAPCLEHAWSLVLLCSCSLAALPVPQKPVPSWKRDCGSIGVIQGILVNKPWCCWYYGTCVSFDSVCVGFNEEADWISGIVQPERL